MRRGKVWGSGVVLTCAVLAVSLIDCNKSTNPGSGSSSGNVSLSGTISNPDGSALAGATVTTMKFRQSDNADALQATTDAQGHFTISGTYTPKPASFSPLDLGKTATGAIIDTLLAMKKGHIDTKSALASYKAQGISAALSSGVLRIKFPLSNSMITGWTLPHATVDSCFVLWSAADLYQDIDGGFERYTNHGMLQAADITMLGPVNSEGNHYLLDVHSFLMDFGAEATAKAMYDYTKAQYYTADAALVPGYDNTVAFTMAALGGITVYSYYKQFYFELILSNYPEATTDTHKELTDAKVFLDYFKSRAQ